MRTSEERIDEILASCPEGGFGTRLRWLAGLEAVDRGSVADHASGVASTSRDIAKALSMTPSEVREVHVGARWHDLGKLATPDEVLHKRGRLTDDEFAVMSEHAEAGVRLLGPEAPQSMRDIAHYHHERYDGAGYHGLKGEEIPFLARVVNVADVHDALIKKREYKASMAEEDALMLMTADSRAPALGRRAFDPVILRTFVSMRLADPTFEASEENRGALSAYARSEPMSDLDGGWEANGGWHLKRDGHRLRYEVPEGRRGKRLVEMVDPAGREMPVPGVATREADFRSGYLGGLETARFDSDPARFGAADFSRPVLDDETDFSTGPRMR